MHDNFWSSGFVLSVSKELNEVKISSFHHHGHSASYMYPVIPHILQLYQSSILAKVCPNTASRAFIHFNQ
jgi:hypothetical protein